MTLLGKEEPIRRPFECYGCGAQDPASDLWWAFYAEVQAVGNTGDEVQQLTYRMAYVERHSNVCGRCKIARVIDSTKSKLDARRRETGWFRSLLHWAQKR